MNRGLGGVVTVSKRALLNGALAAAVLAASPALAQAPSPPTPPSSQAPSSASPNAEPPVSAAGSSAVGEVVVTAQRREQSAQKVSIALTPITPETLADHGAIRVYDLQYIVPSLQVTPQFGSGQPAFTIRGVGFDDYASNNAPTVGEYIDGVAYPIPALTQGQIFDVARVEVLRGPQGTLYGRNSTGGAINIISNKPTDTPSSGVDLEYGRYDTFRSDAFVSGPIDDQLSARISGAYNEGGAWQHDRTTGESLNSADNGAGRLLLDYKPNSDLNFELNLHGARDAGDAQGLYLITPLKTVDGLTTLQPADADHTATGWGTSPQFAKEIGISPDTKPFHHVASWGGSLDTEYQLPFAQLTNLASYDGINRKEYDNFDASETAHADVFFDSRAAVYADELRLASYTAEPFRWLTGFYYSHEHLNEVYRSGFTDSLGLDAYTPYTQDADTYAIFGQVERAITSKLNLVAGLREEHEVRRLREFNTVGLFPSGATAPFTEPDQSRRTSFTKPSGRVALEYTLQPSVLAYVSFSRGVKSGGFTAYNTTSPNGAGLTPFKPETLLDYEGGVKSEFLDHRLRLNGSVYYYDYRNEQVQSEIVDPQFGPIGKIVNAPRAHIYGGEVEATYRPVQALTLTQSVGYAFGRYDFFQDVNGDTGSPGSYAPTFTNRRGQYLPNPKLTLNGSAAYRQPVASQYVADLEIDYSYRSKYFSTFGPLYNVAPYALVDANLTLTPRNGPWSVGLFGRNILNRTYDITRNFFLPFDNIGAAGEPATYGVRASLRY